MKKESKVSPLTVHFRLTIEVNGVMINMLAMHWWLMRMLSMLFWLGSTVIPIKLMTMELQLALIGPRLTLAVAVA